MRRTLVAIAATTVGMLGLTATAQAHHGTITADCEGVTFKMASFHHPATIHYRIQRYPDVVDIAGSFPITTSSMTHVVPLKSYGTQTITASASWSGKETGSIKPTTVRVQCAAPTPTPTPTPVVPTPAPTPPTVNVPPPSTRPVTTQAPSSRDSSTKKRFGTQRSKRCPYGRRQLRDSEGKRFTKCRKAPKPRFAGQRRPRPQFTG